jgi:uncharacterized protein (TIGR03437 family)
MRILKFRILFPFTMALFLIISSNPSDPSATTKSKAHPQSNQKQNSPGSILFVSNDRGENWVAAGSLPDVRTLVIDPVNTATIYAGSSVGLYKSIDGGLTWALSANGLPKEPVNGIAVDPNNTNILYAGTGNSTFTGAVYRSTDGGNVWMKSSTGLLSNGQSNVYSLAIDPSNPSTIYAATEYGLFRSVDSGSNWSLISGGLISGAHGQSSIDRIRHVVIDPSNPNVLYVTAFPIVAAGITPPRLAKSVDGGESWGSGGKSGTVNSMIIDPLNPSTLYASLSLGLDAGVLKSTDGAQRWQTILKDGLTGLTAGIFALAVDPVNPSTIYAGVNNPVSLKNGIYKTTNSGESWNPSNNGLPDAGIVAMAIDPLNPSKLYAATVPFQADVSAASYLGTELARESIVAMFGQGIATETQQATSIPLPLTLANTSVKVKDSKDVEREAPLFFVSPTQINYQMPAGTSDGNAFVAITRSNDAISVGTVLITNVAPGVFSADATGKGVAAAVALRVKADGTTSYEAVSRFDATQNKVVAEPIDLGDESDQVFLVLFGTGWRNRKFQLGLSAKIGDVDTPVTFAGAQPALVGLDQMNIRLLRSLAGKGEVDLVVTVDGKMANIVRISIN